MSAEKHAEGMWADCMQHPKDVVTAGAESRFTPEAAPFGAELGGAFDTVTFWAALPAGFLLTQEVRLALVEPEAAPRSVSALIAARDNEKRPTRLVAR